MIDQIRSTFITLNEEVIIKIITRALACGIPADEILEAVNHSLEKVGEKYADGEYTLSDLMMSGVIYERILKMNEMLAFVNKKQTESLGTILLGTIETDIHDIGKSIFREEAKAEGFTVIDIGVDVSPYVFIERIKEYKPDILGVSAVLTSTVTKIKELITLIDSENLHEKMKIIIGGNYIDEEVKEYCMADGFTNHADDGVELCRKWMENE